MVVSCHAPTVRVLLSPLINLTWTASVQVFLLEIKANLENVARISLPEGHEYCIDVSHLVELPSLACTAGLTLHICSADSEQRRRGHSARSQSILSSGTGLARQQGHSSFHAQVSPYECVSQQLDGNPTS